MPTDDPVPLPMPDMVAYTEGEALYPELWNKLRGCWVPGLFSGPVWDFSESKDGANIDSAFRTKVPGIRTGVQSGEEFDGANDYFSITMNQISSTEPENGWTLVMKLRRFDRIALVAGETGVAHFGSSGANSHYPWTDAKLYIDLLANSRIIDGDVNNYDRAKWHDLTITSLPSGGAGTWNCYQAGVNIKTGDPGAWHFQQTTDLTIGASRTAGSYKFPGQIRHVLLYNRILDLETIQRLDHDPLYTPYTGIDSLTFAVPTAAAGGMLFRHPGMTGRMQDMVGGMKA